MTMVDSEDFVTRAWPREIRVRPDRRSMAISFDTGDDVEIAAELLRVESPSAEVQGHGPGGKTLVAGKRDVTIEAVEPVGNYAVRIRFSDGHDTGLYPWRTLHKMGLEGEAMMAAYLGALEQAGLARG